MGEPLKSPPVYATVAQVRFNPVLKLADFLPDIQEGMRRAGFPAYQPHDTVAIQLSFSQDRPPTPQTVVRPRFAFGNVQKTHSFILDIDALTLQSTDYGRFEDFSGFFMKGLALVHEAVTLNFTDRIGLRYLDRVFPSGGDELDQYLTPEALGLSNLGGRLGGRPQQSYVETICEVGTYKLRSRVVLQGGGLAFPPDMVLGDLLVLKRLADYEGFHAIIDNDGFLENRENYSPESVAEHLDGIHTIISNAFHAIATDYARKVWSTSDD